MIAEPSLNQAWGALRVTLGDTFSFNSIKDVLALAGIDVTRLAHLEQISGGGGATKGQLITALDREIGRIDIATKSQILNPLVFDSLKWAALILRMLK